MLLSNSAKTWHFLKGCSLQAFEIQNLLTQAHCDYSQYDTVKRLALKLYACDNSYQTMFAGVPDVPSGLPTPLLAVVVRVRTGTLRCIVRLLWRHPRHRPNPTDLMLSGRQPRSLMTRILPQLSGMEIMLRGLLFGGKVGILVVGGVNRREPYLPMRWS